MIVIDRIAVCWLGVVTVFSLPPSEYSQHSSHNDFLKTSIRSCHSSSQNPPGSSQVTQYKLKVLSPARPTMIWPCLWLLHSHPSAALLASTLRLNRLDRLNRGPLHVQFPLPTVLSLNYVLVLHCRSFPKCHLLKEGFLSHCF